MVGRGGRIVRSIRYFFPRLYKAVSHCHVLKLGTIALNVVVAPLVHKALHEFALFQVG